MSRRIIPKVGQYKKIQVISFMQSKLRSNSEWAKRACVVIYEQQSKTEKKNHTSKGKDGWGFTRIDAPLLTHYALEVKKNRLPKENFEKLCVKMEKYARQLICISCQTKTNKNKLLTQLDLYYGNNQIRMPF
jgi:hypothetical protein